MDKVITFKNGFSVCMTDKGQNPPRTKELSRWYENFIAQVRQEGGMNIANLLGIKKGNRESIESCTGYHGKTHS